MVGLQGGERSEGFYNLQSREERSDERKIVIYKIERDIAVASLQSSLTFSNPRTSCSKDSGDS